MSVDDRDGGTAADDEARRTRLRNRGLAVGLGALVLGTLFNKALGQEQVGRLLVAAGALVALAATWRPLLLGNPFRRD